MAQPKLAGVSNVSNKAGSFTAYLLPGVPEVQSTSKDVGYCQGLTVVLGGCLTYRAMHMTLSISASTNTGVPC